MPWRRGHGRRRGRDATDTPDRCQACAANHQLDEPHNRDSLFYQLFFYQQTGRWPNWADAMAHCSEEVQALWTAAFIERGIVTSSPRLQPGDSLDERLTSQTEDIMSAEEVPDACSAP
jgi:hypothetical protein